MQWNSSESRRSYSIAESMQYRPGLYMDIGGWEGMRDMIILLSPTISQGHLLKSTLLIEVPGLVWRRWYFYVTLRQLGAHS
jgi:hypothetical protein